MKFKQVDAYRTEDVPDHVLHEITEVAKRFYEAMEPLVEKERPNISLSAINFVLAAVTKTLINDDIKEQRRAAMHQAKAVLGNIAMLNGLSLDEFMNEQEQPNV